MFMSKTRIGIIGAGGITAKMHLPELEGQQHRSEVVLLSGRKDSRLRLLCERFDVPRRTTSYDDVINDPNVDAVIIATPHAQHVSWGLKALAAGKHVLMQKPLCEELGEADAFVDAAARSPRTTLCLPHFPPVVHAM